MVLKSVKDVLLKEVREALEELATSILQHLKNAGQETWGRLLLERLFLLYYRSDDVLEENSEYYCLRLLLDSRSPHASYFIDLFHQLEWLLVALGHTLIIDHQYIIFHDKLPQVLCLKATRLLRCIRPAASSCRFLFLHSEMSRPASEYNHGSEVDLGSSLRGILQALSQRSLHMNTLSELQERFWELELNSRDQEASTARRIFRSRKSKLSQPTMRVRVTEIESQISNLTKDIRIQQSHCFKNLKILGGVYMEREGMGMLRKAKADRALPTDSFNAALKFLPFENLDKYAEINRVELGAKLGEGGSATVYKGNFMTGNYSTDQTSRKVGPTRAVKVFRNGLDESSSSESAGSSIRTRKLGSQFLKQMEAVEKLNEKARSTKCSMEESLHSFSSSTTANYSKLSYGLQPTASHDSFNQTEKKITNGELSEELWRIVSAKHPNVIPAFGYIGQREQGESGLVMELMSTSLHKYLEQVAKPPLPELEVVDLMLEIAKGMRFLHECDIVHRDLKPQNVLLQFNNQRINERINERMFCTMYEGIPTVEVKLADFGLAQCLNCMEEDAPPKRLETESCEVVGTHCYMAPELLQYSQPQPTSNNQSSQQPPRSKSKYKMDVFSYGTTCFNILTCYKDAAALNEVILAAGSRNKAARFYEAVKSNEWRASVKGKPEYLVDLIAKCWAFDPSERPTFAKICCLLQRALLCILAPPVIDEQALVASLNSRHVLGDVLEAIVGSSDIMHHVIGSFQMNESIRDFAELARKNNFEGISDRPWNRFCDVLWLCAREFKHQLLWSFKHNNSLDVQSETSVRVLVLQQESRNNSLDVQSETSVRVPVLQQESRRAEVQQFIDIPLTTMDLEWKVYNVLVWCSICSHFLPTHRSQQLMTASRHNERKEDFLKFTLEPFPFEEDAAKVGLDVDKSLMPFLVCFWELSGNDPFFPIMEGDMRYS